MADIAAVVIQTLQWVGAPVRRQIQYLCCFSRNITSLRNEAKQLEDTAHDLQLRVDGLKHDSQVIYREVDTWLQNSNHIQIEKQGILDQVSNVESGCLKLGARFFLSRRAKKTTDRVKELIILGQSKLHADVIAQPAAAAATLPIPTPKKYEFESRKQIEEDIMTTLRGGDVNTMGIRGMGGLGKTTMAKKIMNRARDENLFDEIVITVVSQQVDELKIQLEIGGPLGLNITKEEAPHARVQKLNARLRGTKRILIVLDDVWESLILEDIGIPSDYKECTILLTSRNHDVLRAMDVQKIFGMEVLSEEDSWIMFRDRVGTCVDNTKLNSLARKVVNECKGLPLALTTVGAALKDEVDVKAWKNAVGRLEKGDPDIPQFIAKVYSPLKLSYDVLEPKYQDVFLLCCVYPEDADIPLEQLTYFCMGLCIATGSVEEARNRIWALTKVLKNRSLLLDSEKGDEYVRMHDVVRDVCIYIANTHEGYIGDNDLTSSLQRYKLDSGFELLQIRNSDEEINFHGLTDLYVLSIERCWQLTSLPFTQMLRNLYTLVLNWCPRVDTLSVVGELVNLEILICRGCNSIEELPPEIKRLNRLKVLELTWCGNLQRIGRGIISSLEGLEELKMLNSFKKWEGEDRVERENAGLRELGQLPNLRCLEIEIEDPALLAENIRLSSKVDRFTIKSLKEIRWLNTFDTYLSNKKMCLNWDGTTCLGDWFKMRLLGDTECLFLVGNGANKVGKIRYSELGECMKKVVTSMDERGATVFPSIENLLLFKLPKLEEICDDRISSNSFQNLNILKLVELPVLKQLWKSSQNNLGKDFLPQLEVLEIRSCEMMEAVFLWKGEEANENNSCHHTTKRFPKLKELVLYKLPNLISLCQGIEGIEFPLMRKIVISGCGKMKGMVWNEKISGGSSNNASIHALFCPQQVSFGCLKKLDTDRNSLSELEELKIFECQSILSLFTSSMAGNLVNLKVLVIGGCDEMVKVIKDDEEKGMSGGRQRTLLFPKLQELELWCLPKLVSFCESKGIESIQFPVLRIMKITRCGKMKGMVANGVTSNENNSGGSSTNAADIIHLFCQSKQVSFGCLKKLDTDRNSFSELEELKIFGCQSILSLFTSSMAGNLVNLKELSIEWCDEMVEVIKDDEEKGVSGGRQTALLFPKLQNLELSRLPKLVSFCESKGIESIQFPVLRRMEITECGKMKGMVANGVTSNENNSGGSSTNAADIIHLFCQSKQVSFGCVKELEIDWNPFCSNTIHVSLFNGLEKLTIRKCVGSPSLFTSSVAGNFLSLEVLNVSECNEMVEVIKDEEEKGTSGDQRAILFPKLHTLELIYLHNLVSFCKWKCDVEFPSLRKVVTRAAPNMKNFTLGSLAAPNLESFETDLNNYLLQVPFISLKELLVEGNEKPLNCYQIHGSVFDRLEVLNIYNYGGSMSLFSSSITGNLVNLTTLIIVQCFEMVKVIEEKEEEKEKVVSGAQRTTILFPKLHKIALQNLPALVRFCEWKCDVELPSLTELRIYGCDNMKSFTLGHLNTPKLESVDINWKEFGGVKDLNGQLEIKEEQN